MRKLLMAGVLAGALSVQVAIAQKINRPNSVNYTQGVDALNDKKYDEALALFTKELEDNPKNGYAQVLSAVIYNLNKDRAKALTAADLAEKYIPKKDKRYRSYIYQVRSDVYAALDESDKALNELNMAIECAPDDTDLYEDRAHIYYKAKKYDLSDSDYRKVLSLDKGNVIGYMGLGRNADAQQRYEEAIGQFDLAIKLFPDYASGYAFRAESLVGLNKYVESIDDIIKALDIDGDDAAFDLMKQISDSVYAPLSAKLKIQSTKDPSSAYWPFYLGVIASEQKKYRDAIGFFESAYALHQTPSLLHYIADCYDELGDHANTLAYMQRAYEGDTTNTYAFLQMAANVAYADRAKGIEMMTSYIEKEPEDYVGYYIRADLKRSFNRLDDALEDLNLAMVLDPSYSNIYLNRGEVYALKGDSVSAVADFKKVIELDSLEYNKKYTPFALAHLGKKDEAIGCMTRVIEDSGFAAGEYYQGACFYAQLGETDKALECLELSLEKGYRRFPAIEADIDLQDLWELPEFKNLIAEYKKRNGLNEGSVPVVAEQYKERVTEIPFVKDGSLCKVKCSVNNLPLYFIFDTGASTVSMSNVEAAFMFKNDYLSDNDVKGKQNYMTASGDVNEGTVVNLRNVGFGGLNLQNVRASIVKNQKAPLLLGQSVLQQLGRIEIDNEKQILKITYMEKQ